MNPAPAVPAPCRFGKPLRLLSQAEFKPVFDRADFRLSTPHLMILARAQTLQHPRLGLVISKKHCRRAVDRNRVKRIVREHFRRNQYALGHYDYVVLARSGLAKLERDALHACIAGLWDDAQRRVAQRQNNAHA